MSYAADVQSKIILKPCRRDPPDPSIKIYTAGARAFDVALVTQADPFAQPRCRVIKSEKKIKVGFMPMSVGGDSRNVYIKQHNVLTFGHRLAALFFPSAAMRSLAGALTLIHEGYQTAQPVAAVEFRRCGVLMKSLYFSEEVRQAKTLDAFWRENLAQLSGAEGYRRRRKFLRSLARLLASLHGRQIYHNDLKASNILIRRQQAPMEELFSLIDLQGIKRCYYVSKRRRIKNLAQLERTLGQFLSRSEKLFFLKAYSGFPSVGRLGMRALTRAILAEAEWQKARENHHARELQSAKAQGVKTKAPGPRVLCALPNQQGCSKRPRGEAR